MSRHNGNDFEVISDTPKDHNMDKKNQQKNCKNGMMIALL
jgi:hypothetical protein